VKTGWIVAVEHGGSSFLLFLVRASARMMDWATPGILEAMKPGRMQGHGGTAEVPG